MSQVRLFSFLDKNTSLKHNERLARIVKPGVYYGFFPRVSALGTNRVDIALGNDKESVLVTVEGVIIKETNDLSAALTVNFSTVTLDRIDLCVCEYRYNSNPDVPAIYKIIEGTPSTSPVPPKPDNEYQLPLFYIEVAGGASALAQYDLRPVDPARTVVSEDLGPLKPIIDPTNRKRIYAHPGVFPNKLGTNIITFYGGYSPELTVADMMGATLRYFLYGVGDDGSVGIIASSSASDAIEGFGGDAIPVCIAEAKLSGVNLYFTTITDIRFPYSRRLVPQFEEDVYNDVLGTSVFQYNRLDLFEDESLIDLDSLLPADGSVTVEVNRVDTSLTFETPAGPSADVTIVTENLLLNTTIPTVYHFMMLVDTPYTQITFDYSTTSKTAGFTGIQRNFNSIIHIVNGATSLYIQFFIPQAVLTVALPVKIFSYCLFAQLDFENLNTNVLNDAGIVEVVRSQKNLIANPFVYWSRPDDNGYSDRPIGMMPLSRLISSTQEEVDSGTRCFGPDGWQVIEVTGTATPCYLSRTYTAGESMPRMLYTKAAGGPPITHYVEFRTPTYGLITGRPVTFSVDCNASNYRFGIGLQFYKQVNGTLSVQGARKMTLFPQTGSGTLTITSDSSIGADTVAIGFILYYNSPGPANYATVWNPRAVLGRQSNIHVLPPMGNDEILAYYERGRSVLTGKYVEGETLTIAQSISPKHTVLGSLVVSGIADPPLVNTSSPVFDVDEYSVVSSAAAASSGYCALDTGWQVSILYKRILI